MMVSEKSQDRQRESQESGKGADAGGEECSRTETGEYYVLGASVQGAFEYKLVGRTKMVGWCQASSETH